MGHFGFKILVRPEILHNEIGERAYEIHISNFCKEILLKVNGLLWA